ncbi:MAG TPA: LacI family DNA-binding transcriptional regulator [Chthoniobacteraceae bacterium]|nr:LacI family DNA-binding transcriptional regulator [Chthoniobacteraceae bacterium]
MKDVAEAAGVCLMTVSYALRDHPSISEATRGKVHRIARELGYIRNPLVSALVNRLRTQREIKGAPSIAYVCSYADRRSMMANPFRRAYYAGAEAEAERHGCRLELFLADDYSSTRGKRLTEVLRYRNVQGVIMGISPLNSAPIALDWSGFAGCVIGYSRKYPGLHRVDANYTQIVSLAISKLTDIGYSRIGMLCGGFENRRVEGVVTAAIAGYNSIHRRDRQIPVAVVAPKNWNPGAMRKWVEHHRLEALITQSHTPYHFLRSTGLAIPEELALVTLENSAESSMAGIDQKPQELGAAAARLVIRQLDRNLRGLPSVRRTTLLDGVWIDGATVNQPQRG